MTAQLGLGVDRLATAAHDRPPLINAGSTFRWTMATLHRMSHDVDIDGVRDPVDVDLRASGRGFAESSDEPRSARRDLEVVMSHH